MAMTVHCDIVSAEESLFSGLVKMVIVSGVEGELGISYGHAQLLTHLKPGPVRIIKDNGDEEVLFLSGGYAEIQPNMVTILADIAERDIDEDAAKKAREEAEHALRSAPADIDYARVSAQLAEAEARLRTLQAIRKAAGK
ncbi:MULTISPECIES: F0F1 ATP synthase subunit epsilon [Microbulbifer]|uniref:ATP synthase epsilon chain n=1 Tax=Microbulbifer agarilyticus TaxID=260552 RepID=A0A1Q2M9N4_9GAMM|nr:F0F1 ATP synthase subunit epsilon [Microbulbifer agarilyticus]AQQ69258.1 F0F1 ATP synthase subunit epsilon [Microbulbifer agarilyticus]MBY6190850.1 F0F1 ATP synthase subunit epsilon [Microbulbifer agarilyticus]MBY6211457.1 F0F1 ATP synthase subunit epsilon [Microbulbifer agarilyticus]MCA0893526.1 F0F1 ATP synthase subunit epsilon [Microbulbifer agarilyticus]MCA0900136.1 F0F1 ATP synthase subunit epsilon [Microbulbifer agarilyticus]